jgi:two-component system chemotaxis sensor kinase CheA
MQIDLSRFKDTYFEEATDHVATIESSLLTLEERSGDRDVLDAIFRAAHSVKGGSGIFGLTAIGEFTHALESVLDRLREGEIACSRDLVDLLLQANDVLRGLLASARTGVPEPGERDAVLVSLGEVLKGATASEATSEATAAVAAVLPESIVDAAPSAAPAGPPQWRVHFVPNKDLFRQGLDPLVLFRDLAEVSHVRHVTLHEEALPDHATFDPESCYLGWTFEVETEGGEGPLRDVFLFAEDDAVLEITPIVVAAPVAVPAAGVEASSKATTPVAGAAAAAPQASAADERRLGQRRVLADRRPAAENASIRVATEKDRPGGRGGDLAVDGGQHHRHVHRGQAPHAARRGQRTCPQHARTAGAHHGHPHDARRRRVRALPARRARHGRRPRQGHRGGVRG